LLCNSGSAVERLLYSVCNSARWVLLILLTDPAVVWCCCSQNIDDALAKLQEIIDAAVNSVTVKEADPETIKKIEKRCGRVWSRMHLMI
jgi:hypothetical protein